MILVQGISRQIGLSYGQASTVLMLICLLGIFLFDRRYIYPGTLFCIFCLGPLVDLYAFLFGRVLPQNRPLPLTILLIALGCIIVSIGIGISVRSEAGACANDLVPVIIHDHLPFLQLRWTRMIWDFGCILVGFVLGGKLGIGTVNTRVLIIFIFFCKPCKINGLQAFSTLEIVIFLRFDTNLTPIFSFMVSEVHCHTIQLCYLVFNPCSVAQVVIHFHSHIKMSVSHDVL